MLEFCVYTEDFLQPSWEWLNDPEIKKLTMTPDFTKEDQQKFFISIPSRSNYKIFGITLFGEKIGACGLKNISEISAEYWGYIGNKSYWGRGYGKEILHHIKDLAKELQLKSIYLKVSKENVRAISLYEKNDFIRKQEMDDYLVMELSL